MKIVRNMIGVLLIFVVFSSNLWATPTVEEIMKKIIYEGISKAILNIYNDEGTEFTKKEIKEKKEELKQFVHEYFDKKFKYLLIIQRGYSHYYIIKIIFL